MTELPDIPLGHTFTSDDLDWHYPYRLAAVRYPDKRPGFAVVVGMARMHEDDGERDIHLLAEAESPDLRELVRQCGVLHHRYQPQRWVGDGKHKAGNRFIRELNAERQSSLHVRSTAMLDMERPYEYLLPSLKALLTEDRRHLFLKDSRIVEYLSGILPDEIPFLPPGAYPAIEALAFAVIELQRHVESRTRSKANAEEIERLKSMYGFPSSAGLR